MESGATSHAVQQDTITIFHYRGVAMEERVSSAMTDGKAPISWTITPWWRPVIQLNNRPVFNRILHTTTDGTAQGDADARDRLRLAFDRHFGPYLGDR